jgi:hypothetical protein
MVAEAQPSSRPSAGSLKILSPPLLGVIPSVVGVLTAAETDMACEASRMNDLTKDQFEKVRSLKLNK